MPRQGRYSAVDQRLLDDNVGLMQATARSTATRMVVEERTNDSENVQNPRRSESTDSPVSALMMLDIGRESVAAVMAAQKSSLIG